MAQLMTMHISEKSSRAPTTATVNDVSDQVAVTVASREAAAFFMGAVTPSGS